MYCYGCVLLWLLHVPLQQCWSCQVIAALGSFSCLWTRYSSKAHGIGLINWTLLDKWEWCYRPSPRGERNWGTISGLVCSFHRALLKGFGLKLWALSDLRGVKFSCQQDWLLWPETCAGFVTTVPVRKCFLEAITPGKRWFFSLPCWEGFTSFSST